MIHKGSCLCGGVRYEIHGKLSGVLNCHCSMCRKAHGAAFRTRAAVRVADFRWLSGEELLTHYEEWYGFPLGTLDTDPGVKPACHVFVGSKAPWHDITDDLPQYEELPDR